ncbi:MAG: GDP-mannose 4,6-dehydratase [Thermoflexales bacterium]|nr:GDP-mannose 4,6-dehydratase [Thermoflexales bacterium]
MTILITGAAGFIGSHLAQALLARGERVVGLDNFNDYYDPARKRANVRAIEETAQARGELTHFSLVEGDIRDEATVQEIFSTQRPMAIVHAAAMAGVRRSVQQPLLYEDVNVRGTLVLLEAARKHETANFVCISSSSVYGNNSPVPFREDALCDWPLSPYPATKRAAELMCATYHHLYDLPCTCLRLFTVLGPRGRPDMTPYHFTESIVQGREITLFDPDSVQRDFTYVGDIVQGILAALEAKLPFEIVNLGNHRPVGLRDYVAIIERLVGKPARVRVEPLPPTDARVTCADIGKAQRLLGFAPATPVEEGLARFWDWYRANVMRET